MRGRFAGRSSARSLLSIERLTLSPSFKSDARQRAERAKTGRDDRDTRRSPTRGCGRKDRTGHPVLAVDPTWSFRFVSRESVAYEGTGPVRLIRDESLSVATETRVPPTDHAMRRPHRRPTRLHSHRNAVLISTRVACRCQLVSQSGGASR